MIKTRCFRCGQSLPVDRTVIIANELAAQGDRGQAVSLHAAECPRCRRANKIPLKRVRLPGAGGGGGSRGRRRGRGADGRVHPVRSCRLILLDSFIQATARWAGWRGRRAATKCLPRRGWSSRVTIRS